MEKDAIRNQKVFVELRGVLEFQDALREAVAELKRVGTPFSLGLAAGFKEAVRFLALPIKI